ncbi:HupE/UreJ family protein [Aquimarina litoralis]|uniref:HupE/UreJ family protein n=1 Tax=Aquimarina litoralis TaxID=584605 RepID=UPI001C58D4AE|nr:HupE/UreJ family protein [Aquimarina litoralis]MBW1296675.1 HupE/UreJ family protein [Aquimarina litoralis]
MDNLSSFFINGWDHIVDIKAYDHLLFVMTLCAAFKLEQWKQILVIITAFTIGHSGTLILSALDVIPANSKLIDTLIPFTIMITAIANIINYGKEGKFSDTKIKYTIALVFGLIHGLAFASNFKVMLFTDSILMPLFAFNVGIEVGQLFIVFLFMFSLWLYTKFIKGEHLKWNLFISGAGFGIAATIFLNALYSIP